MGHALDCLHLVDDVGIGGQFREDNLRGSENASQQIVEVMRDSAGKQTHAFQLLSGQCLLLSALQNRNINIRTDVAFKNAVWSEARNSGAQHPSVFPVRATAT